MIISDACHANQHTICCLKSAGNPTAFTKARFMDRFTKIFETCVIVSGPWDQLLGPGIPKPKTYGKAGGCSSYGSVDNARYLLVLPGSHMQGTLSHFIYMAPFAYRC
jgi:hypothetical protein